MELERVLKGTTVPFELWLAKTKVVEEKQKELSELVKAQKRVEFELEESRKEIMKLQSERNVYIAKHGELTRFKERILDMSVIEGKFQLTTFGSKNEVLFESKIEIHGNSVSAFLDNDSTSFSLFSIENYFFNAETNKVQFAFIRDSESFPQANDENLSGDPLESIFDLEITHLGLSGIKRDEKGLFHVTFFAL